MPKDAYFFSHDSNARHDPKILKMRSVYKLEGLGLYWSIIEMMREQDDYKLPITNGSLPAYAFDLHCEESLLNQYINDCIEKFNLFQTDGDNIWSLSLLRRMEGYDRKSDQAREAANIRWQSERNADALHTQSERNASKVKYSKVNNIKENNTIGVVFKTFEDNFQKITQHVTDRLNDLIDEYTPEKVLDALKIAIDANKRELRYVEGILKKNGTEKKTTGKYSHLVKQ